MGDINHAVFLFILLEVLLLWSMIIFPGIVLGLLGLIYKGLRKIEGVSGVAKFITTEEMEWKRSPVNTKIMAVTGKNLGGLFARLEKGTTMEPHKHAEEQCC